MFPRCQSSSTRKWIWLAKFLRASSIPCSNSQVVGRKMQPTLRPLLLMGCSSRYIQLHWRNLRWYSVIMLRKQSLHHGNLLHWQGEIYSFPKCVFNWAMALWLFLFFISNKDIYWRTLPYAKKHRAERKIQKDKIKRTEKRKEKILITKERAKEHRERVTRGESSSSRPVKQRAIERSQ